jgi:hypothetical protein
LLAERLAKYWAAGVVAVWLTWPNEAACITPTITTAQPKLKNRSRFMLSPFNHDLSRLKNLGRITSPIGKLYQLASVKFARFLAHLLALVPKSWRFLAFLPVYCR